MICIAKLGLFTLCNTAGSFLILQGVNALDDPKDHVLGICNIVFGALINLLGTYFALAEYIRERYAFFCNNPEAQNLCLRFFARSPSATLFELIAPLGHEREDQTDTQTTSSPMAPPEV